MWTCFLHTKYIALNETEGVKIITETFENLLLTFKSPDLVSNSGGGMVGAIFGYVFYSLFKDGTNIVVITLGLLGLILCFNLSIYDMVVKFKNKAKEKAVAIKEKHHVEEKEHIVHKYIFDKISVIEISMQTNIPQSTIYDWITCIIIPALFLLSSVQDRGQQ